jgi:hypothetical protein
MVRVGITTEPPATKALSCSFAQEKEALFFVFEKHQFGWVLMGGDALFFYRVISLKRQQEVLWHG